MCAKMCAVGILLTPAHLQVSKRSTGVIIESPLEMSLRLYGEDSDFGKEMSSLLRNAKCK